MTTATSPAFSLTLEPDASPWRRFVVGTRALQILAVEKENAYYARLLHLSFDREVYARLAERMRAHPTWRRILEERKSVHADGWDYQKLSTMPEGTLGHAFTRYYAENGIYPFDYQFPLVDDVEVLAKRYRETHDVHHMITGYGIDPIGEIEIQAFYFGNLGLRHAAFISLFSVFSSQTGHQWKLGSFGHKLLKAYRRGKASPMILGVPFNELWDKPVSQIAAQYVAPPN